MSKPIPRKKMSLNRRHQENMLSKYLHALATPGKISSSSGVFIGGVIAMVVVFVLDLLSGVQIRLHALYIFPLTIIALHCERKSFFIGTAILSLLLQLVTFFHDAIPLDSLLTDEGIAIVSSLLIVFLARQSRINYLTAEDLACRDALTGLLNRRAFNSIVEKEMAKQMRYGSVFSLAVIDLDNFKELNDTKGHAAGDKALKLVSEVLLEHTRYVDSVSRLGGDEFAILIPETREPECNVICHNLATFIEKKMNDVGFPVTASIGYATFVRAPESLSWALQAADKAMYAAKGQRKNSSGKHKISKLRGQY
ncbi:MAG: GGDEF domain-containing protein [Burkholderiaceae bacterium]